MKGECFTEEQIISILKEHGAGAKSGIRYANTASVNRAFIGESRSTAAWK